MKGLSWLIEITVMNEDIRVEEEITYLELSKKYKEMFDGPIMGVRVGNTLKELTSIGRRRDSFCRPVQTRGYEHIYENSMYGYAESSA